MELFTNDLDLYIFCSSKIVLLLQAFIQPYVSVNHLQFDSGIRVTLEHPFKQLCLISLFWCSIKLTLIVLILSFNSRSCILLYLLDWVHLWTYLVHYTSKSVVFLLSYFSLLLKVILDTCKCHLPGSKAKIANSVGAFICQQMQSLLLVLVSLRYLKIIFKVTRICAILDHFFDPSKHSPIK